MLDERRVVRAVCRHVLAVAERTTGTANTEVLQRSVSRLRTALRRGRLCEAENLAYGVLMDVEGRSEDSGDDEAAENDDTSKTSMASVERTVNIGRGIKFVRVAAGIKQGAMAARLGISQNYLSLLENNKAEPSLALLRRISEEFNVPVSFLLLESSTDYESDEAETHELLQKIKQLIHGLQEKRVRESRGAADGTAKPAG